MKRPKRAPSIPDGVDGTRLVSAQAMRHDSSGQVYNKVQSPAPLPTRRAAQVCFQILGTRCSHQHGGTVSDGTGDFRNTS